MAGRRTRPGLDVGRPVPFDALYFAVLPERRHAEAMVRLGHDLRRRGGVRASAMAAERLHVSIAGIAGGLGLSQQGVEAARRIGGRVSWPDFDLLFTRATTFGGGALVLRCSDGPAEALRGLRDQIADIIEDLALGRRPGRAFEPHLTFAWGRGATPQTGLDTDLDEVVRWPARELVLVHSEQGLGRHHHLARWPLGGRRIEW